jgi:hypothetical protein
LWSLVVVEVLRYGVVVEVLVVLELLHHSQLVHHLL